MNQDIRIKRIRRFKWIEAQNFSDFEKGIVVGLMTAWIETFMRNKEENNFKTYMKNTHKL